MGCLWAGRVVELRVWEAVLTKNVFVTARVVAFTPDMWPVPRTSSDAGAPGQRANPGANVAPIVTPRTLAVFTPKQRPATL